MKVFITGVESFVGKELIKIFKKYPQNEIYGCDLNINKKKNFIKVDIRKKNLYKKIPKNIDVIIHLAAISRDKDCSKDLYECYNTNVNGTLNVLEAAKKLKIKKVIFASSEWVYHNDLAKKGVNENSKLDLDMLESDYAKSKLISENHCKFFSDQFKIDITVLRFGIIYGERKTNWSAVEALFNNVKKNDNLKVGSLKTARGFIHINDICNGIVKSIKLKKYNIINLQGMKLFTLKDIINSSEKILNKKVKVIETNPRNPSIRKVSSKISNNKIKFRPIISLEKGLLRLNKFLKD